MATLVTSTVGGTAGPGPSYFRAVLQLYATDSGSGYYITARRYIEVTAGDFGGTRPYVSWSDSRVAISGVGAYGVTDTDLGHYSYGSTVTLNEGYCKAYYTSSSAGTTYTSTAPTLIYTIPVPSIWNDINALNPSDVQDQQSAYFDLSYSDGTAYYNLTNETDATKPYGTVMTISNIRPYYSYYELSSVNGATNYGNGVYKNTMTTANHVVEIHMKYKEYAITINPNGGTFSDGSTVTTTLSPNLTYNSTNWWNVSSYLPTRDGYQFLGYYDTNGEQVYDSTGLCIQGTYWSVTGECSVYQYAGNLNVYAQWEANTYTLTFDANTGINVVDSLPLIYESNQNADISAYIPTKQGYEFLGWYSSPSGGVQIYDSFGICTNEGTYWKDNACVYLGDYIVYAQWKPLNIAYYKSDGKWNLCNSYIKTDGSWKPAMLHKKTDGDYIF